MMAERVTVVRSSATKRQMNSTAKQAPMASPGKTVPCGRLSGIARKRIHAKRQINPPAERKAAKNTG